MRTIFIISTIVVFSQLIIEFLGFERKEGFENTIYWLGGFYSLIVVFVISKLAINARKAAMKEENIKETNTLKFTAVTNGEWKCIMFGDGTSNQFCYFPEKGGEPNWFWRKMQYLILGFKWVKKTT